MPVTKLDAAQVIQHAYDEANNRIRTDATLSASSVTVTVDIQETDDSILVYGNDGSTNRAIRTDALGRTVTVSTNYALRLDDTSTPNVTYVGQAAIGSGTGSAVWQIKKIDETTGMTITWVDSNDSFDNIWDNRTGLTYG
jgi:hypothetical protein